MDQIKNKNLRSIKLKKGVSVPKGCGWIIGSGLVIGWRIWGVNNLRNKKNTLYWVTSGDSKRQALQ